MSDALPGREAGVVGQLTDRVFCQAQDAALVKLDLGIRRPAGAQPGGLEQRRIAQGGLPGPGWVDLRLGASVDFTHPRVSDLGAKTSARQHPQRDPPHSTSAPSIVTQPIVTQEDANAGGSVEGKSRDPARKNPAG